MASRVCCCASVAALQNFTWAASAMQRALAAIEAVEMACYASLRAPLCCFSHNYGEVHAFEDFVLILQSQFSYHSMRHADYPYCLYLYQSRAAGRSTSCGALWQPKPGEPIWKLTSVGQGFGLPLRSVSAARNTHTTILELPSQR